MVESPLLQEVTTLPALVEEIIPRFTKAIRSVFPKSLCESIKQIFITGCGDSYYAPLNARLAFAQLAGLPCEPLPALQFSRYTAPYLSLTEPESQLLMAVSASGGVSRTVEALRLGRQAGALAVALTAGPESPLGKEADIVLETAVPPLSIFLPDVVVPGTRSYVASQLMLYLCAIHVGERRGHLASTEADTYRNTLLAHAPLMKATIERNDLAVRQLVGSWHSATHFVYCGAGPNFGTAHFNAAKCVEASGDVALAQELEEWAHIQYFGREVNTPMFILNAQGRDHDRLLEIVKAAVTIGRRLAVIGPPDPLLTALSDQIVHLETAVPPHECFSPLLLCLPGIQFAAYRAQQLAEPYFRDFKGGRSVEGGGGISRIRTSHQILEIQ